MIKKSLVAFLVLLLTVSTLTNSVSATGIINKSEDKNPAQFIGIEKEFIEEIQDKYDTTGDYLEDNFNEEEISKIKEEYLEEYGTPLDMDGEISTMAMGFWTVVIAGALSAIIASATIATIGLAWNWLMDKPQQDGSETTSCTAVKISDLTFNPSSTTNWVGSGYNNDPDVVKALQKYINRAALGVTVTVNGKVDFATSNAILKLEEKLGHTQNGYISTADWMKMGGDPLPYC